MLRHTLAAILCVSGLAGCASPPEPKPTANAIPGKPWVSGHFREHPLAGRVWDVSGGRYVSPEALVAELAKTPLIALGEKHDNPDHHIAQTWILKSLIARGRRPAVAFEMIDSSQAPALAQHLADRPNDAAGLGSAVGWHKTGWPKWEMYQPIAGAAMDAGLPILSANLPRKQVRKIVKDGVGVLGAERVALLALDDGMLGKQSARLLPEIAHSHCGQLPETLIEPMARAQITRNAVMAEAMRNGAQLEGTDGAVLIAGGGHTRGDVGAPWHLNRWDVGHAISAVGMIEVSEGKNVPADYARRFATDRLPFDFVWFTPRVETVDPCEKYADQLRRARERQKKRKSE